MKEALLKKRYGIPAALLILLVLSGVATAVVVQTFNCTITTKEPLSLYIYDHFDIAYQGESDTIKVKVTNASDKQGYGIFVDVTVEKGNAQIDSITYPHYYQPVFSTELGSGQDVNNDGDMWDARYNIRRARDGFIWIKVDSADNVSPGGLGIELDFHREAKYQQE